MDREIKEKRMNLTNVSKYAISSNWRFAKENHVEVGTLTQLRYIRADYCPSRGQSGARPPILC